MSEVNQNVNDAEYEDVYEPMLLDGTGKDMVQALAGISQGIGELVEKIHPVAKDIPTSAIPGEDNVEDALKAVDDKIDGLDGTVVKTVNAIHPDENGELKLTKVAYADNFTSDKTQNSEGEFVIRTAGGDASIADGDAFVMRVYGNRAHEGYVPESLSMAVAMAERVAPDPITAVLDDATFEAYVEEAGTYTLSYTNAWDKTPGDYGVTVTGTPLSGDQIVIVWDGEGEPAMEVIAPRSAPGPIIATIDRDTFVGYVAQSGVTTLTYTTVWSANPALYGVTVTGTPVSGDTITITYYKEERGTIKVATPTALKSTGWNLYNHTAGYAYLCKYSSQYGFLIGGTYTALQYSETLTGAKTTITPVDGVFTIPEDGYVWVTGGNGTDTYILNQWSDWTDGPAGEFEAYSETVIDLSTVMSTYFPNGLCRVGVARDEINLNASVAISKIDRMAYSAENLAAAKASGRAFEYDTNYIYIVKASYVTNAIVLDGSYTASDHGNEFFTGSEIPVYLETMYGNNLKNKLERDVLTISQQTLTAAQKAQVLQNVGAASQSGLNALSDKIENKYISTPTTLVSLVQSTPTTGESYWYSDVQSNITDIPSGINFGYYLQIFIQRFNLEAKIHIAGTDGEYTFYYNNGTISNVDNSEIGKYNVALPNDTTSANFKDFVTGVCTAFNALNVSSVPYLVYAKWVTHSWYLFNMVKDGNNVVFNYSCADSGGFGRYIPSTSALTVYEVTATAI